VTSAHAPTPNCKEITGFSPGILRLIVSAGSQESRQPAFLGIEASRGNDEVSGCADRQIDPAIGSRLKQQIGTIWASGRFGKVTLTAGIYKFNVRLATDTTWCGRNVRGRVDVGIAPFTLLQHGHKRRA